MTNIHKDIVRAKSTYQNNKIYWTCWIWELHYLLSSQFGRSSIINNHYNAIELATNWRNDYDNTGMKKVLRHLSQIKRLIVLIINPKLDLRCVADLDDWIKYIAHNSHYFYWWHIKCIQRFIHEILCVYIRLLLGFFVIIDCAPWMWKIISYYEFLSLYIVFVNSNKQRASIMSMVIFFFFIFLCACIFHNTDCLTDISFSSSSFSPPHHKSCARIFTQQQKNTLSCVFLCCVVVSNELQFLLLIFKSEITMKPTIS